MRARVVLALFAITAIAVGLEALVAFQGAGLMGDAARGSVTPSQYASFASTAEGASVFYLLAAIPLAIAFIAWLSRTVENIPALGAGTPKDSPRWAIAWWFVPIAFLWKPYQVVRESWDRLAAPGAPREAAIVLAWWLTWIASTIGGRFAAYSLERVTTFDDAAGAFWLMVATDTSALAAAILGLLMVREVQSRADARARHLGFERALPHAGRVASET